MKTKTYLINQSAIKPQRRKRVTGELIDSLGMPGSYAVRKSGWWLVDHIETGFVVCYAMSKRNIKSAFKETVEKQGLTGFRKAIAKAERKNAANKRRLAA